MKNESTFATSKEAYKWCLEEGKISKSILDVFEVICDAVGPMNQTMAHNAVVKSTGNIGLQKYSVSPRFAVLERMGLIQESGKGPCPVTTRTTVFYEPTLRHPVMSEAEALKSAKEKDSIPTLKARNRELELENKQLRELLQLRSASHTEAERRIKATKVQVQTEMFAATSAA